MSKLISPPYKAESIGKNDLLATRIALLSFGPFGLDNPVVMLFRTATAAHGHLPVGLLGSGFLHRVLLAIDVPGTNVYLPPKRTYDDPPPNGVMAALRFLPARQ